MRDDEAFLKSFKIKIEETLLGLGHFKCFCPKVETVNDLSGNQCCNAVTMAFTETPGHPLGGESGHRNGRLILAPPLVGKPQLYSVID